MTGLLAKVPSTSRPLANATRAVVHSAKSTLRPQVNTAAAPADNTTVKCIRRLNHTSSRRSLTPRQQHGDAWQQHPDRVRDKVAFGMHMRIGERSFWARAAVCNAREEEGEREEVGEGDTGEEVPEEELDVDDMWDEEELLELDWMHRGKGGRGGLVDRGMHIKQNTKDEEQAVQEWLQRMEESRKSLLERAAGRRRKKNKVPEVEVEDTFVFGTDPESLQHQEAILEEFKKLHERGKLSKSEYELFKRAQEIVQPGAAKVEDVDVIRRAEMELEEMEEVMKMLPASLSEAEAQLAEGKITRAEYLTTLRDELAKLHSAGKLRTEDYEQLLEEIASTEEEDPQAGLLDVNAASQGTLFKQIQELDEALGGLDSRYKELKKAEENLNRNEGFFVHGKRIRPGPVGVHEMNLAMSSVEGSADERYEKMLDILRQCSYEGVNGDIATYQLLFKAAQDAKEYEDLVHMFETLQLNNSRECLDMILDTLYFRSLVKVERFEKAFSFMQSMADSYGQLHPDVYGDMLRYGKEFIPLWENANKFARMSAESTDGENVEKGVVDEEKATGSLAYVKHILSMMSEKPYVRPTKYIIQQALDLIAKEEGSIDFALSLLKELQVSGAGVELDQRVWISFLSLCLNQGYLRSATILNMIEESSPDFFTRRSRGRKNELAAQKKTETYFYGVLMRLACADSNKVVAGKIVEYLARSTFGVKSTTPGFWLDLFKLNQRFPDMGQVMRAYYPLYVESGQMTTEVYEVLMMVTGTAGKMKVVPDPSVAFRLLQDMERHNVPISNNCYYNALKSCSSFSFERHSEEVVRQKLARQAIAIDTCVALFNTGRMAPDSYIIGELAIVCAQGNQFERAIEILKRARDDYPGQNVLTSTAAETILKRLTSVGGTKEVPRIMELVRMMRKNNFSIRQNDFRAIMSILPTDRQQQEFKDLIEAPKQQRNILSKMGDPLRKPETADAGASTPTPSTTSADALADILNFTKPKDN